MFMDKGLSKKNSQEMEKGRLADRVDLLVYPQEDRQSMEDSVSSEEEDLLGFDESEAKDVEKLHHAMLNERPRILLEKVEKNSITIP